jgi:hypothetical protein
MHSDRRDAILTRSEFFLFSSVSRQALGHWFCWLHCILVDSKKRKNLVRGGGVGGEIEYSKETENFVFTGE